MIKNIYPEKIEKKKIVKLKESDVAVKCIEQMELYKSKAQAIGIVLNGSDDVETFNKVWDSIVKESKDLRSISLDKIVIVKAAIGKVGDEDYKPEVTKTSSKTQSEYKADLLEKSKYLDSDKFYNGLLEEKGTTTFTGLKEVI